MPFTVSAPRRLRRVLRSLVWLAGAAAASAQALTITALSPQGEVAQVRQIKARFSANAIHFGDPRAPAPLTVSCDDAAASRGEGRWTSAREWVYDFAADLPPGVRCRIDPVSGFKSAAGELLTGASSYQFHIYRICRRPPTTSCCGRAI